MWEEDYEGHVANLSEEEIFDIYYNIDKEKYPERYRIIVEKYDQINRRKERIAGKKIEWHEPESYLKRTHKRDFNSFRKNLIRISAKLAILYFFFALPGLVLNGVSSDACIQVGLVFVIGGGIVFSLIHLWMPIPKSIIRVDEKTIRFLNKTTKLADVKAVTFSNEEIDEATFKIMNLADSKMRVSRMCAPNEGLLNDLIEYIQTANPRIEISQD